jgi:hypothetical protein
MKRDIPGSTDSLQCVVPEWPGHLCFNKKASVVTNLLDLPYDDMSLPIDKPRVFPQYLNFLKFTFNLVSNLTPEFFRQTRRIDKKRVCIFVTPPAETENGQRVFHPHDYVHVQRKRDGDLYPPFDGGSRLFVRQSIFTCKDVNGNHVYGRLAFSMSAAIFDA